MLNYTEEGYYLGKTHYGNHGALALFYTRSNGKIKAFCHAVKSKKTNLSSLYPLDRVELELTKNLNQKMPSIRSVSLVETFVKKPTETMGNLFLSELLCQLLDYPNESFYQYLRNALQQTPKGWYLNVCWKWIEMEGLMPDWSKPLNAKYWDMCSDVGVEIESEHTITAEKKQALSYFVLTQKTPSSTRDLLENTLAFLKAHVPYYKTPQSLKIISKVY